MSRLILLTGATGYVGGRLLAELERRGDPVRCLSRRPEYLRPNVAATTEVVQGDVLRPETVRAALEGVDTMVYLVHSMSSSRPFAQADADAAHAVGEAAVAAGVRRIVYLGGLGSGHLSEHLASRQEVGRVLRAVGRPDDRAAGLDRDRLRQRIVRDDPRARRAPSGDGHPAMGAHANAADCDRGRAGIPPGGDRP